MRPRSPLLSVVVVSYTEKRLRDLQELVQSIKRQSYPYVEIVLVIEKSNSLYSGIKGCAAPGITVFSPSPLGISKARNLGREYAKGDIIAFVDDDAVVFLGWADALVDVLIGREDIIGLTGPAVPLWEDDSLSWFPEELYWIIGCSAWKHLRDMCDVDYAWGVNMAFKREAFDVSSFTGDYTRGAHSLGKAGPVGDDREFSLTVRRKTGKRIVYSSKVRVWHKVPRYKLSPNFLRRYAYWQGYSDAMFKHRLGASRERLRVEYHILRRLLTNLWPSVLRDLLHGRREALKKIGMILSTVAWFTLGYLHYVVLRAIPQTLRDQV